MGSDNKNTEKHEYSLDDILSEAHVRKQYQEKGEIFIPKPGKFMAIDHAKTNGPATAKKAEAAPSIVREDAKVVSNTDAKASVGIQTGTKPEKKPATGAAPEQPDTASLAQSAPKSRFEDGSNLGAATPFIPATPHTFETSAFVIPDPEKEKIKQEISHHNEEKYEELRARRKEKAQKFQLFGDVEDADPDDFLKDEAVSELPEETIDDYESFEDAQSVEEELSTLRTRLGIRVLVTGLCAVLLAILALGPALHLPLPQVITAAGEPVIYLVLSLSLTAICMVACASTIKNGILSLVKLMPDCDSMLAVSSAIAVVHALVLFAYQPYVQDGRMYPLLLIAVLGFFLNTLGKLFLISRIRENFSLVSSQYDKYAAQLADTRKLYADELSGATHEVTCVNVKTGFLSDFLKHSYSEDPSDHMSRYLTPIAAAASLVVAVIVYFRFHSIMAALTTLSLSLLITTPLLSTIAGNLPLYRASKKLNKKSDAIITGYSTVEEFYDTGCVIIGDNELFDRESITLQGIKTYAAKRIDQSILEAASVACAANGPLSHVFLQVLQNKKDMLLPVEGLAYEDGMGLSAWVSGKRVLIGNRQLLKNHGIRVPSKEEEKKYTDGGMSVIYLSAAGELSAMFIVTYSIPEEIVESTQRMVRQGIALAVKTSDVNVTAALLSDLLRVDESCVKILPTAMHKPYQEATRTQKRTSCGIAHLGPISALFDALRACIKVKASVLLSVTMQVAAVIIGFTVVAVYALLSGLLNGSINLLTVFVFEAIWTLGIMILPSFRRM